jgi:tyrosyl-tRNA synthetase
MKGTFLTTLNHNVEGIKGVLSRFLDFNEEVNAPVLVNNYDWMKELSSSTLHVM